MVLLEEAEGIADLAAVIAGGAEAPPLIILLYFSVCIRRKASSSSCSYGDMLLPTEEQAVDAVEGGLDRRPCTVLPKVGSGEAMPILALASWTAAALADAPLSLSLSLRLLDLRSRDLDLERPLTRRKGERLRRRLRFDEEAPESDLVVATLPASPLLDFFLPRARSMA